MITNQQTIKIQELEEKQKKYGEQSEKKRFEMNKIMKKQVSIFLNLQLWPLKFAGYRGCEKSQKQQSKSPESNYKQAIFFLKLIRFKHWRLLDLGIISKIQMINLVLKSEAITKFVKTL